MRLAPSCGRRETANDLHVELGRDRAALPLAERVAQVVAAYPLVVAPLGGAPARIDARYANGLAASIRPGHQIRSRGPPMRNESKDLIVGLDIGTSKVVVAVAEVLSDGRFK